MKTLLLGLITFCFTFTLYGQQSYRENDYRVNYLDNKIELVFDVPVFINAYCVARNEELSIRFDGNGSTNFILENLQPAEIVEVEYRFWNDKSNSVHKSFIANASLSTGTINVYFNHPVDINYAQTQNAVNLGSALDDKLIEYIDACGSTLDIAIYNSYSASGTTGIAGAINAAYTRGVQVRVIYDGSTSSVMIPLLNSAIPTLASPTGSSYAIMHNKFVVFDANSSDANKPIVWTGSTNWTVAQIDGPDKNNAIVIQDQALALGYKMEFDEMWGSSGMIPNTALSKFGPYKTDNTPHSYLIGGRVVNSYFSPSDGTTAKIIAAINSATSDIDVSTMLITRSDISSAIINKYTSGLPIVDVVVDSQNPMGNQISVLQGGLPTNTAVVYTGSGILHHKFLCVDNFNSASDPQVLVGSHNWSTAAETKNDENTLIVHDANITNQYYQAFAYLFAAAGGVLSTNEHAITKDDFVLYPNPTNGVFTIEARDFVGSGEISVYDVLGNRVFEQHLDNFTSVSFDLGGYSNGLYFVGGNFGGKVESFKVVKE